MIKNINSIYMECCDNKNIIFTDITFVLIVELFMIINIFMKFPVIKMKIIQIEILFQNHFIKE